MAEIRKMDANTSQLLTWERTHHPKADVDRLYVLRNKGVRDLTQLETIYRSLNYGTECLS